MHLRKRVFRWVNRCTQPLLKVQPAFAGPIGIATTDPFPLFEPGPFAQFVGHGLRPEVPVDLTSAEEIDVKR